MNLGSRVCINWGRTGADWGFPGVRGASGVWVFSVAPFSAPLGAEMLCFFFTVAPSVEVFVSVGEGRHCWMVDGG